MAELTAMRNNILGYPVYGLPYVVIFPILDTDGDPVTGLTPDTEVSKNGDTAVDTITEAAEIAFTTVTNKGMYQLQLSAAEMTANSVAITVYTGNVDAQATPIVLYPKVLPKIISAATAGATGNFTTAIHMDGAKNIDDYYNGCLIYTTGGTGAGQVRMITDYVASTKVATVSPAFNTAPDNTTTYDVYMTDVALMYGVHVLSMESAVESGIGTAVWATATRTLSSFGTLIADIWAYVTRGLTTRQIGAGSDYIALEASVGGVASQVTGVASQCTSMAAQLVSVLAGIDTTSPYYTSLVTKLNSLLDRPSFSLDQIWNHGKRSLTDPDDMTMAVYEHIVRRRVVESFLQSWSTTDALGIASTVDFTTTVYGGSSLKLFIDIVAALNDSVYYTFAAGREVNLSDCNAVAIKIKSGGAGNFLQLRMSEDNVTWFEYAFPMVDADIDEWVEYIVDVTSMVNRSKIKYVQFKVISEDIDISIADGVQLWPTSGISTFSVYLDKFEGVLVGDSGSIGAQVWSHSNRSLTDPDMYKANLTNVAAKDEMFALSRAVSGVRDMVSLLVESISYRHLIDNFEVPWISSDAINVVSTVDYNKYSFGGQSNRVWADIATCVGKYIQKEYQVGNCLNLSKFDFLRFTLWSEGAGDFLKVRLSENGTSWFEGVVNIADSDMGKWKEYSLSISGMTSRSSVRYIRFQFANNNIDVQVVSGLQLWNLFGVSSINVWIDKIEAYNDITVPIAGNWV